MYYCGILLIFQIILNVIVFTADFLRSSLHLTYFKIHLIPRGRRTKGIPPPKDAMYGSCIYWPLFCWTRKFSAGVMTSGTSEMMYVASTLKTGRCVYSLSVLQWLIFTKIDCRFTNLIMHQCLIVWRREQDTTDAAPVKREMSVTEQDSFDDDDDGSCVALYAFQGQPLWRVGVF